MSYCLHRTDDRSPNCEHRRQGSRRCRPARTASAYGGVLPATLSPGVECSLEREQLEPVAPGILAAFAAKGPRVDPLPLVGEWAGRGRGPGCLLT